MEEIKQKNISSYFTNLKRSSTLDLNTFSNKRNKQNDIVKIGDSSNYTINKFFNLDKEKDETYIDELKSGLKKLDLTTKNKLNSEKNSIGIVSNFNLNESIHSDLSISSKLEDYFIKSDKLKSSMPENKKNVEINYQDEDLNKRVFSLDNFQFTGNSELYDPLKSGELVSVNKLNNLRKKVQYEDTKITNWVKYITYNDLNGLNEYIFQNILKYLNFKELTQTSFISKTFFNFYKNTITSYPYFVNVDTSKYNTKKEFSELLKKSKHLKHIQKLNEVIKNDFGGEKYGPENFYSKVQVIMSLSQVEDLKYKGTLLKSFKIKSRKECNINNLISNESVINICQSSRYTLQDLLLRGCFKLTNRVASAIQICTFLEKIELSHNNQIDDEAISIISASCSNIKAMNLSNLKLITGESVKSISQLKQLEGLDLSDNINIKGDSLIYLRNCPRINRLILNGIKLTDNNLIFTDNLLDLTTLSITSKNFIYKITFNI